MVIWKSFSWAELKMLSTYQIAEFLKQRYLKKQVNQEDILYLDSVQESEMWFKIFWKGRFMNAMAQSDF